MRQDILHDAGKIIPFQECGLLLAASLGAPSEGPPLKHLGVEHEAARLPVQELDSVPGLVDEDVHVPVVGITGQDIVDDAAKGVVALAHVGGAVVQEVPHAAVQTKHGRMLTG